MEAYEDEEDVSGIEGEEEEEEDFESEEDTGMVHAEAGAHSRTQYLQLIADMLLGSSRVIYSMESAEDLHAEAMALARRYQRADVQVSLLVN